MGINLHPCYFDLFCWSPEFFQRSNMSRHMAPGFSFSHAGGQKVSKVFKEFLFPGLLRGVPNSSDMFQLEFPDLAIWVSHMAAVSNMKLQTFELRGIFFGTSHRLLACVSTNSTDKREELLGFVCLQAVSCMFMIVKSIYIYIHMITYCISLYIYISNTVMESMSC